MGSYFQCRTNKIAIIVSNPLTKRFLNYTEKHRNNTPDSQFMTIICCDLFFVIFICPHYLTYDFYSKFCNLFSSHFFIFSYFFDTEPSLGYSGAVFDMGDMAHCPGLHLEWHPTQCARAILRFCFRFGVHWWVFYHPFAGSKYPLVPFVWCRWACSGADGTGILSEACLHGGASGAGTDVSHKLWQCHVIQGGKSSTKYGVKYTVLDAS